MKFIDKDALIAEIKKRLWLLVPKVTFHQQRAELEKLLSFIDTLEVKEVDLEKEFESFLDNIEGVPRMWHSDEQIEWAKDIARHFFELGLKAQKGENNESTN